MISNSDGTDDIIASPGVGKRAEVRVFDGVTGLPFPAPLGSFLAFEHGFLGGVHVACGDVTGDSIPDIIAARGALAKPEVRVFNGVTASPLPPPLGSFLAFEQRFLGGVRVAACDLNQDSKTDIIAARGPLGQPEVRTFDGVTGNVFPPPLGSFLAFNPSDRSGAYVACGDLTGDTIPDIIAGKGLGKPPEVRVFNGVTAAPLPPPFGSFLGFNSTFPGGVRVASCDPNQDGRNDIIAGRGPGAQPEVRTFDGVSGTPFPPPMGSFLAFGANFKGGAYVACSPIAAAPACPNGFCGWEDGDVITHGQSSWGEFPTPFNAAGLLLANYDTVYASTFGVVEVGISGVGGFSILFTDENSLLAYLPALGPIGPLTSDFVDPSTTMSGGFGGHVMALRLNVDFSDAGLTLGTTGVPFGDLTLCNFTVQPLLNGLTVRQFLGEVSTLLGGGTGNYSIAELSPITDDLNSSFDGVIGDIAHDHLVIGACP